MKQLWKRMYSWLLVCVMILPIMPATAVTADRLVQTDDTAIGDFVITDEIIMEPLDKGNILDLVDTQSFEEQNFVYRSKSDEQLNSYVFQKPNGEKTLYLFTENVKYIQNGQVLDKDITLVREERGYGLAQNDVLLHLPDNPSRGVMVGYATGAILLRANDLAENITGVVESNTMIYYDAFGSGVDLKYTPLLSGVKEEIVLSEYVPGAEYTFTIDTIGISLYNDAEGWYFAEDSETNAVFRLGDVVVYDAVGCPSSGNIDVSVIREGSRYSITIGAEDSFLSDPNTVYPVTIDPTILVDTIQDPYAIMDAPIFSNYPDENFGDYIYNRVGTVPNYGIGRTVMRIPGLTNSSIFQQISADQITSAYLYITEASGTASQNIHIYPLTAKRIWTEESITWSTTGLYSTDITAQGVLNCNEQTAFNITDLVRAWKNGTYAPGAGFVMISDNEEADKAFFATDSTTNRPYVVMTYRQTSYDNPEIIDYPEMGYPFNEQRTVNITGSDDKWFYKIVVPKTGFYTFNGVSNEAVIPVGRLYNSYKQSLVSSGTPNMSSRSFQFTYHLMADTVYYFVAESYANTTGSYIFTICHTAPGTDITDAQLNIYDSGYVSCSEAYSTVCYKLTPPETGKYLFFSEKLDGSPAVLIYDDTLALVAAVDATTSDGEFYLVKTLRSNRQYYFVFTHNSYSSRYFFKSYQRMEFDSISGAIENASSGLLMDIYGPDEQTWVQQFPLHAGLEEHWTIKMHNAGYCTIQSSYGDHLYVGVSGTTEGTNNIQLFETINDNTKWELYKDGNGRVIFEPQMARKMALYAATDSIRQRLQLRSMSAETIGGAEIVEKYSWWIVPRTTAKLVGQNKSTWCWVASAMMFADHYYDGISKSQKDAVDLLDRGWDDGGTEEQIAKAIDYFADCRLDNNPLTIYRLSHTDVATPGILSEENVCRLLDAGHVIYITRTGRDENGDRKPADSHGTIITGYIIDPITEKYQYVIYDPYPAIPPDPWNRIVETEGVVYTRSYEWICSGRTAQSGEPMDEKYWEGYVIPVTGIVLEDDYELPIWMRQ